MTDERDPVSPDEFVIRLIWTGFYHPTKAVPIQASAFAPRADEYDGISVFRAACVAAPDDALAVFAPEKRDRYGIALLLVADILGLGLTVRPAPIPEVPGHALVPEMNIVAFTADRIGLREVQKQLAALANDRLVRAPKP